MLLVGLTGGIGAGKSTVAALLASHGAVVVDADALARRVVEPGRPAFDQLVARFGPTIVGADGTLDRAELARLAFAGEDSRRDLEAITHPAINAEFRAAMEAVPADAVVVHDVPLLVESATARGRRYEHVIVVEAPREVRLERLGRRGVARADAEARMAAQATDEQRRAVATWVVDNSGDEAALAARVDELWADLVALRDATAAAPPA